MDNNQDIIIEGSEATWVMPRTEAEFGVYTGTFKFRCFLSPLQDLQAGREYRELLGSLGNLATETEAKLAWSLSQLKHRVISSPPFWSSSLQDSNYAGNIGDIAIISLVVEAAYRAQDLFKAKLQKERNDILERSIKISEEKLKKVTQE